MQALSKYYKKILKLFVEYSKNKTVQKTIPKGWMWLMLSCLQPQVGRWVDLSYKCG